MNRKSVREFVESRGVVMVRADKTEDSPEIDQLLSELGNAGGSIPFYAIYPAGGGKPVTLDGVITQSQVLSQLKQATEGANGRVAGL